MIGPRAVEPGYAEFMFPRSAMMIIAIGFALAAQSVPEVTSSAKNRTGLGITIYQGGLAMVRDTRHIEMPQGTFRIAIADVAASIRPKSAWITFQGAALQILERNFEFDLLSPWSLMNRSLGKEAGFRADDSAKPKWGTQVSLPEVMLPTSSGATSFRDKPLFKLAKRLRILPVAGSQTILRSEDGLFTTIEGPISFRHVPNELRVSPTLLADVSATQESSSELELAYTAEKFGWEATYLARLSTSGHTMDLEGFVTLTNTSGTDFPNATLQLVAGEPNQVEDPAPMDPDRPEADKTATVECIASSAPPRFKEERLAEYVLLTLDRPTTLRNGQTKQVKLFEARDVPVARTFLFTWAPQMEWLKLASARTPAPGTWVHGSEFLQSWALRSQGLDPEDRASWEKAPWVHSLGFPADIPHMEPLLEAPTLLLEIQNDQASKLGRPLPQGSIWFSTWTPQKLVIPMGQSYMEATPAGERTLISLPDGWVASGLRAAHRWRTVACEKDWIELEGESNLTNPRSEMASILLRLILPEGTEIRTASTSHAMLEPGFFDFRMDLPPRSETAFRFRARVPQKALPLLE